MMNSSSAASARLLYWSMLLTVLVAVASILVISNNSIRSAPIFVLLLLFGVAVMAAWGFTRGGLVALLMVSGWIAAKEAIGVWHAVGFVFNVMEVAVGALAFVVAGLYHDRVRGVVQRLADSETLLQRLDLEDVGVGLIKPPIGMLRLEEEEQRAVRFRRPFSLALALVSPRAGVDWEPGEGKEIMRAVAAAIKDTTRSVDIPFLAGSNRIALILPETDTDSSRIVLDHVRQRLAQARAITHSGAPRDLKTRAEVRIGLCTFLGFSAEPIRMLEGAEASLQQNLAAGPGDSLHPVQLGSATPTARTVRAVQAPRPHSGGR